MLRTIKPEKPFRLSHPLVTVTRTMLYLRVVLTEQLQPALYGEFSLSEDEARILAAALVAGADTIRREANDERASDDAATAP